MAESTSSPTPSPTRTTLSPALEKFKSMGFDESKLQVIQSYSYENNGDVLVELLGPREQDQEQDSTVALAPVVLTAGHGGRYKPEYIANRTKDSHHITKGGLYSFCSVTDLYTIEVGLSLVASMMDRYMYGREGGAVPYIIINHLDRSKVDVNRYKGPGAQDDPVAQGAWQAYHDFIALAQSKLRLKFGTVRGEHDIEGVVGLLIDIHGYSGNQDWLWNMNADNDVDVDADADTDVGQTPFIHWGYRLPTDVLNKDDISEDAHRSTFAFASSLQNHDLESLIRGPKSLASRFYSIFQENQRTSSSSNFSPGNNAYCGAGIPSSEFPNPMKVTMDPHWCGIARAFSSQPGGGKGGGPTSRNSNSSSVPSSCRYFSGGYTTIAHEHLDWQSEPRVGKLRMNTCQMELPRCIRFGRMEGGSDGTAANRTRIHSEVAHALTDAIYLFLSDLFPSKLGVCVGPTGTCTTETKSLVSKMEYEYEDECASTSSVPVTNEKAPCSNAKL